ncbi:hypothetical protein [Lactiplantibacillus plantarum]|uniref:hypothetical protein n=1 Tax=Lactiplantibacillus plantarum TaxID=1590 RepID=UPI00035079F1|nr:hypothetical protein [Lactiplantibacillus plantarum]AGO08619.1 hypothetical protein Lp16_1943 [Lactiplantibacillus plantarum 16]KZU41126.1 Phage protein [Lactiplantibacillus plantarum]MBO2715485.1 hypothetical protein [Lactiplantibacillus plantarum]MCG0756428.1 hypothetical protein [Lactiplantibacillus plantarum]
MGEKILGLVLTIVFGYITYRLYKNNSMKKGVRLGLTIFTSILTVSSLVGPYTESSNKATDSSTVPKADSQAFSKKASSNTEKEKEKESRSESKSSAAKVKSESKSQSASSSKSESQSESKLVESTKNKNEQKNFEKFQQDLGDVPSTTKGSITSANYDQTSETLKLTLSDEALDLQGAQLKEVVRAAWNAGNSLVDSDKPFPDDKQVVSIIIQDSAGNQLAHSSAFLHEFKYDADK